MSHKAQIVDRKSIKDAKYLQGRGNNFEGYVNAYGTKRLINRIISGRKVMPCGRECWEFGFLIAAEMNHGSFMNFNELMNDADFLIAAAKITPNPVDCENYMYFWVNNYLKKNSTFKLQFLKSIYMNENVYKLEDINIIVESLGLIHENKILLADEEFMAEFKTRLEGLDYQTKIEYHCSGLDEKELHDYKVQSNNLKVICDNIRKGLTEILKTFVCYVEEKPVVEEREDDFWANYEPRPIRTAFN